MIGFLIVRDLKLALFTPSSFPFRDHEQWQFVLCRRNACEDRDRVFPPALSNSDTESLLTGVYVKRSFNTTCHDVLSQLMIQLWEQG
jgi:hypothetical protein